MEKRELKRLNIIIIYIFIFLTLGFLIYFFIFKQKPTCSDGKQNQNEKGVDCGGVCLPCPEAIVAQDIKIKEQAFVYGGAEKFDVMAKIANPNDTYGSRSLNYVFYLKDTNGNILAERSGQEFILPAEEKYIIENNLVSAIAPSSVEFKISNPNWEKFSVYEKPDFNIYGKKYTEMVGPNVFGEVYGVLRNNSDFDFNSLIIKVVLRDSANHPISFNKTEMRTVYAGEERDFRLIWPFKISEDIVNVEAEAEADIYDIGNFIKKYSAPQEFQRY